MTQNLLCIIPPLVPRISLWSKLDKSTPQVAFTPSLKTTISILSPSKRFYSKASFIIELVNHAIATKIETLALLIASMTFFSFS